MDKRNLDRRNTYFRGEGKPDRAKCQALERAVAGMLCTRKPWKWDRNSCHLDTYLMMELATYSTWVSSDERLSDNDIWPDDKHMNALYATLVNVGKEEQNAIRMSLWAQFFSDESPLYEFGSPISHMSTMEMSSSTFRSRIRTTTIRKCSNPVHEDQSKTVDVTGIIQVVPVWFKMPPFFDRRLGDDASWQRNQAHMVPFVNTRDMLMGVLARSDEKIRVCLTCKGSNSGMHFYKVRKKPEQNTLMPPVLHFDLSAGFNLGREVEPELQFCLGGHVYDLVCVVFYSGSHYNCRVKLNNTWYDYDDMGCRRGPTHILCLSRDTDHIHVPFKQQFHPVMYRYVRTSVAGRLHTNERLRLGPEEFPNDVQFHEMMTVLDGVTV